jgi:hypothetical protein
MIAGNDIATRYEGLPGLFTGLPVACAVRDGGIEYLHVGGWRSRRRHGCGGVVEVATPTEKRGEKWFSAEWW